MVTVAQRLVTRRAAASPSTPLVTLRALHVLSAQFRSHRLSYVVSEVLLCLFAVSLSGCPFTLRSSTRCFVPSGVAASNEIRIAEPRGCNDTVVRFHKWHNAPQGALCQGLTRASRGRLSKMSDSFRSQSLCNGTEAVIGIRWFRRLASSRFRCSKRFTILKCTQFQRPESSMPEHLRRGVKSLQTFYLSQEARMSIYKIVSEEIGCQQTKVSVKLVIIQVNEIQDGVLEIGLVTRTVIPQTEGFQKPDCSKECGLLYSLNQDCLFQTNLS
ncbi:hypothetical protein J6590_002999 [Homalodisca vitripennis]|nr:hypothetical protein J6590_002999 [Homalodisca vitripennis]